MTRYNKYIDGQTEEVYKEIDLLGQAAFLSVNFPDIDKVLIETFQRVAYNLDIIYDELQSANYLFKKAPKYNFEKPLHKPLSDTESLLKTLDNSVKPFGFVPLSLKYFYKIVGGVNFVWDYDADENFMWNMADPIQIASLDAVVKMITDESWQEEMQDSIDNSDVDSAVLNLSADDLHKDNVSGGPAYAIQITKEPSIDSNFINEPHATTFIDYLRTCFEYCGFPGITNPEMKNNYQTFFDRVRPQLKKI